MKSRHFSFSSPSNFEDAIITRGEWRQLSPTNFQLELGGAKLNVEIDTPSGFSLKSEQIDEFESHPFSRLGIVLNGKTMEGRVRMIFRPEINPTPTSQH